MQHGEGKQPPPNTSRMHGAFRDRAVSACFYVFSVFLLWDQQELKTTDLSSVETSRDPLRLTEELFWDQ